MRGRWMLAGVALAGGAVAAQPAHKPFDATPAGPESTAPGPSLIEATRMAQAALAACAHDGFRVGVAVGHQDEVCAAAGLAAL